MLVVLTCTSCQHAEEIPDDGGRPAGISCPRCDGWAFTGALVSTTSTLSLADQGAKACPSGSRSPVLTALGALLGHHGGDYLAQDDCMSAHKRTAPGRVAGNFSARLHLCRGAGVTKWAFYRTAGVRVPWLAQLTGVVAEGWCMR
ncbi:hypothetical protein Ae717Ps2_7177 [Pseudonocardia sp. Ae717_Ps2]|nr:hypothetical protein Ae717Ps2_7177 [Pseudonocardia sp. Ae717_Ps2]